MSTTNPAADDHTVKSFVRAPLAVAALTLLGFLVRLRGIGQSLGGDELLSWFGTWHQPLSIVVQRSPEYRDPNPPLFFLLAKASESLGDATVSIRLPSLIAGTLLVPLVWALGRRIANERAALAGAALTAVNLTAVFYSNEARPYELLAFLGALNAFVLLKALDSRKTAWWLAWALTAAAVMYTHYTGLFVVLAGFVWACWTNRDQIKSLFGWAALAGLMFVPWIPSIGLSGTAYSSGKFVVSTVLAERLLRMFIANPFDDPPLLDVPGAGPLILFAVAVAGALLALTAEKLRSGSKGTDSSLIEATTTTASTFTNAAPVTRLVREPVLLGLLAIASPVGMLVTSALTGSGFLLTRYLSPSFAALILVLAAVLTAPRGRLGVALACAAVAASAWGCVVVANQTHERPDMRAAAAWIDRELPVKTVVADNFLGWDGQRPLAPYLKDPARTPRKQWNFPGAGVWFAQAVAERTGIAIAFTDCPAFRALNTVPPLLVNDFRIEREAVFPGGSCGIRVRYLKNRSEPK